MSSSILFICRSCNASQHRPPEHPADGAALFDCLHTLHQEWKSKAELDVRGVDCLWTCDHPCCVALTATGKPTYVLANVPIVPGSVDDVAEALLTLSEHYLDSTSGSIPWKQFPSILQTEIVARIPPVDSRSPNPTN